MNVEQACVPFAEDNLPTVRLGASAEGNTEKCSCRGSCALPGEQMATNRTLLQNILLHCSSIENRGFFIGKGMFYFLKLP